MRLLNSTAPYQSLSFPSSAWPWSILHHFQVVNKITSSEPLEGFHPLRQTVCPMFIGCCRCRFHCRWNYSMTNIYVGSTWKVFIHWGRQHGTKWNSLRRFFVNQVSQPPLLILLFILTRSHTHPCSCKFWNSKGSNKLWWYTYSVKKWYQVCSEMQARVTYIGIICVSSHR